MSNNQWAKRQLDAERQRARESVARVNARFYAARRAQRAIEDLQLLLELQTGGTPSLRLYDQAGDVILEPRLAELGEALRDLADDALRELRQQAREREEYWDRELAGLRGRQ